MHYLLGVLNSDLSLYNNMLLIICTKETYIYCNVGLNKKRSWRQMVCSPTTVLSFQLPNNLKHITLWKA